MLEVPPLVLPNDTPEPTSEPRPVGAGVVVESGWGRLRRPRAPVMIALAGFGMRPLQCDGLLNASRTGRGPIWGEWWWHHDKAYVQALVLQVG